MPDPAPLTVIHTSDWHLGHELSNHGREAEHDVFLAWLLDQLEEQAADVLLVTGDVYDVANPPVAAMRRLFGFLRSATERRPGLQVVILGGNHDSAARIDLPSALLGEGRVRFVGAMPRQDGAPDCESILLPLRGAAGTVSAWLAAVPFCRPGDLGRHTLPLLYAEVLDRGSRRAGGLPLIVTGHLHVAGGEISELSERRIVIGGEEAQAASLFDARAAYVALGHLHRPQSVAGAAPIRYAGSPFPLSAAERTYRHALSVVTVSPGKAAEVEQVPIPRPAPFLAVPEAGPAPLDEVVAALEALQLDETLPRGLQPFLEISVLVDGPEPHLQARVIEAIRDKSVRLTRIARVAASPSPAGTLAAATGDLADLQPASVFEALFRTRHDASPPGELARAFEALLVEVHAADGDA